MQAPVEIRYAGVVVASAQDVRELSDGALFLSVRDPLPVGTLVSLRSGADDSLFRVCHVIESSDQTASGMQIQPARPDEDAMWIPSEVPKAKPVRVVPMPAPAAPKPEVVVAPGAGAAPVVVEAPVSPEPQASSPEPVAAEPIAAEPIAAEPFAPEPAASVVETPPEAAVSEAAGAQETETAAVSESEAAADELPPARPTQGGGSRRRTKRRRST